MIILTINSGSSSIKFSVYEINRQEKLLLMGRLERIAQNGGRFIIGHSPSAIMQENHVELPSHEAAFQILFESLKQMGVHDKIHAIGHRILTGGKKYHEPHIITSDLMDMLTMLKEFDIEHLPNEIKGIELAGNLYPSVPQVACFDTSFHRDMPLVAELYAIPRHLYAEGVIRYGFHGLSYEYVLSIFNKLEPNEKNKEKIIIAHLGNGASIAAIKDGKCIDTSMGFTPTGGLVMGTRCGDLDPGVMYYLLRKKSLSASELFTLLNEKSGMLGVSNKTGNMEDLLKLAPQNQEAKEAIELFCYSVKKYIGSYIAALDGLDTLIFTGGIGEHAGKVREIICQNLNFIQLELEANLNAQNASIISQAKSHVIVRIIPTNEELMIARHSAQLILNNGTKQGSEDGN